jgi:hypothetical protein
MPGTNTEATEQGVPTPEVGATTTQSDNALDIAADNGSDETTDATPPETGADDAPEADDADDAGSDDQPEAVEPEFVGLDQYLEDGDLILTDNSDGDTDQGTEYVPLAEIPKLDPDSHTNEKRWQSHWEGALKFQRQLQARDESLSAQEAVLTTYRQIDSDLKTPEGTRAFFELVVDYARQEHGLDLTPAESASQRDEDYTEFLWNWESDEPARPQKDDAEIDPEQARKAMKALGLDPDILLKVQGEQAKLQEENAFRAEVNAALPSVNQRLQSNFAGMQITPELLAKAMKAKPGYSPYDAVIAVYETPLLRHSKASVVKPKKSMPTMPKGSSGTVLGQEATLDTILNVRLLD